MEELIWRGNERQKEGIKRGKFKFVVSEVTEEEIGIVLRKMGKVEHWPEQYTHRSKLMSKEEGGKMVKEIV